MNIILALLAFAGILLAVVVCIMIGLYFIIQNDNG
jgi:cell division protein FtsN